ncbi:hypothetical protein AK830_g9161 [Neonectria ditissima]|uniref:Uncharacterized protein n=1 Tax=Neonectria ditissima TaxID=78410 RepID=A0A0P7B9M0_9HYPO|nr:hypothetical protein AK830_g9161 [Neonectria ditissima]
MTPSSSPETLSPDLVPFKPKQLRRFYEPVILFKALNDISRKQGNIRLPDHPPKPKTDAERFRLFLDKIASVCDQKKGGPNVTAVTILDQEDAFLYVFACNQVSLAGLKRKASFLSALLKKISGFKDLKPAEKNKARENIVNLILVFNRERIERYLKDLQGKLQDCLESCGLRDHDEVYKIERCLQGLKESIGNVELDAIVDEADYLESCLYCLREIKAFQKATKKASKTNFIDERADEGRASDHKSMACWSEFRHHSTRLLSYDRAVTTLVAAESEWPELFQEVKVQSVPSSRPSKNPLGRKSEDARSIARRMGRVEEDIDRYTELASRLEPEPYNVNGRIRSLCSADGEKDSFKPIVHCEVLVLDWILARKPEPEFFQGWRYIGTSKGTCKMCDYYFSADPSSIKVRPTHGNVYPKWRFPDLYRADGEAGVRRRQNIFNSMMENVRSDAVAILEDRSPIGKTNDSNTYNFQTETTSDLEVEAGESDPFESGDLAQQLTELSFTNTSTSDSLVLSDSDDEEGGTSLV